MEDTRFNKVLTSKVLSGRMSKVKQHLSSGCTCMRQPIIVHETCQKRSVKQAELHDSNTIFHQHQNMLKLKCDRQKTAQSCNQVQYTNQTKRMFH